MLGVVPSGCSHWVTALRFTPTRRASSAWLIRADSRALRILVGSALVGSALAGNALVGSALIVDVVLGSAAVACVRVGSGRTAQPVQIVRFRCPCSRDQASAWHTQQTESSA